MNIEHASNIAERYIASVVHEGFGITANKGRWDCMAVLDSFRGSGEYESESHDPISEFMECLVSWERYISDFVLVDTGKRLFGVLLSLKKEIDNGEPVYLNLFVPTW